MTVGKLKKIIDKLINEGHAREKVCIDKNTFSHPLGSYGCAILEVQNAETKQYCISDDDGFIIINKDGSERIVKCLVLTGEQ